jgi:hypothetical protein
MVEVDYGMSFILIQSLLKDRMLGVWSGSGAKDRDDIPRHLEQMPAAYWHRLANKEHIGIEENYCLHIW